MQGAFSQVVTDLKGNEVSWRPASYAPVTGARAARRRMRNLTQTLRPFFLNPYGPAFILRCITCVDVLSCLNSKHKMATPRI